jgi:glucosamine-6-phosphate deaminase
MQIIVTSDYQEMSLRAALLVAAHIIVKPELVLGLATGSTPIGMYVELARMQSTLRLDFSKVTTFNLDEYVGLGTEDSQSYHYFMYENFFSHTNIREDSIHIPDGKAPDPAAECQHYEEQIQETGGIDLQILGIGRNGHIGFNEPADYFESQTHLAVLKEDTRKANARFFDGDMSRVPTHALSMGMGTIMKAREIILLANTPEKAKAIYKAIEGPVHPQSPASILQLHPKTTMIIASEAAQDLGLD